MQILASFFQSPKSLQIPRHFYLLFQMHNRLNHFKNLTKLIRQDFHSIPRPFAHVEAYNSFVPNSQCKNLFCLPPDPGSGLGPLPAFSSFISCHVKILYLYNFHTICHGRAFIISCYTRGFCEDSNVKFMLCGPGERIQWKKAIPHSK